MLKKTSNSKNQYEADSLFVRTYGSVCYLPHINLLSQLSLDTVSISKALNSKSTVDVGLSSTSFSSGVTIKVPAPPSPNEAMVNGRSGKKFPLGTLNDPETGEALTASPPVIQERSVRNQILHTDNRSGTVFFVDKEGNIDKFGLGHLTPISENENSILAVLDTKIPVSGNVSLKKGVRNSWDSSDLEARFHIDPADKSPEAKAKSNKIKSISNTNLETKDGVPLFLYAKDSNFRDYVNSELRSLELKFKTGVTPPKDGQLSEYYAQLIVAVLFADKHSELFGKQVAAENKTMGTDPSDAPSVPHIKADTRFLPHQAYALSFLKDRNLALVDADPGAGKTLMLLADILDKMNTGVVQRPCIVMPNALLSDQKAEFEDWTQGTMNFIVINTTTVKESDPEADLHQKGRLKGLPKDGDKKAGLEAMTKLIQSAPPNTILLTSYEWLRAEVTETGSGTRYNNASWLSSPTKAGIDMVVLDESHKVRLNSSGKCSAQANAVMQLRSLVPYRRCYTGTSAPGSPEDVFLQMAFLDPSILGGIKEFRKKYGLSESKSGKIEMWKDGAIKDIRQLMAKTVGVSIRRSAWISELPTMKLSYHKATLSHAQRIVYERIMNRIIKEELGLEYDPATGLTKHSSAMPGSAGLSLQKEMKDQFANNPLARNQAGEWQPSSVVNMQEYDPATGEIAETGYEIGDEDSDDEEKKKNIVTKNFNVSDPAQRKLLKEQQQLQLKEFKEAQARTAELWLEYTKVQDEEDAPDATDFSPLLTKFIAVDKFLNCPTSDEFGKYFLFEDKDKISPKISAINTILDNHFANPSNGKVIIFTHYKDVARHVADSIKMASKAVYYDSGSPDALAKFKKDDSVQIIIAVEQSIQEGQNLQMANRIIRLDLPWNPGNYEQSIARSYRLPPKDPDEKRYSTLYIDLILCEGTAEITKFARMVSKMHNVRQLTSGYVSKAKFRVVGMSLENMTKVNTFAAVDKHISVFREMRDYEIEEAKVAPKVYGTESRNLGTGEELPDSKQIETPLVSSDKERSPWTAKPERRKQGVIKPKLAYLNGVYWLSLETLTGMSSILKMFDKTMDTGFALNQKFSNPKQAFLILQDLREKGLFVINQEHLHKKFMGIIPCDPQYPQSKIDYGKLTRVAAAPTPAPVEFPVLREGDTPTKQVLAYNPSQDDLKKAREIILKESPGKEVLDIHVLAAAKILGLYRFDLATLDLKNFVRMTNRFRILSSNRKVLEEQLSSLVESPVANDATPDVEEDQNTEIPGLESPPVTGGLPVELDVAVFGNISNGKLVTVPAFILVESSLPLSKADEITKILQGAGFSSKAQNTLTWLFLGETKAQAKAKILEFSRVSSFRYTFGNWESFLKDLKNVGCTDLEITNVFPRQELTAMVRLAALAKKYPEYEELTRSVYGL